MVIIRYEILIIFYFSFCMYNLNSINNKLIVYESYLIAKHKCLLLLLFYLISLIKCYNVYNYLPIIRIFSISFVMLKVNYFK